MPKYDPRTYFRIVMVAPSNVGTFVSFTDPTGQLLFCPISMFDLCQSLMIQHPDHSVVLEANSTTTNSVLGNPLFGVHLVSPEAKVTHTIRAKPIDKEDGTGDFEPFVIRGQEAEDLFMKAFNMTPDRLKGQIRKALENNGTGTFDAPADDTYENVAPPKPADPATITPQPVETNLPPNSPHHAYLNTRNYTRITEDDFCDAITDLLAAKEALEDMVQTSNADRAAEIAADIWDHPLNYKNIDGKLLPFIGKLPLPTAFSRRVKDILAEYEDKGELRKLITAVRDTGRSVGFTFPDDPWQILNPPGLSL
jgi:hypothetical protein